MNRNVEIKARVADLDALKRRAAALADEGPVVLEQEDTFFSCPHGRLKLRRMPGSPAELIYYERPDSAEPKASHYSICRTDDAQSLFRTLSAALGVCGTVRKRRTLYLIGPTRVHLDAVEKLGDFVELEVVLRADQDVAEGTAIAHELMDKLGLSRDQLVERAYIDLLPETGPNALTQ
jgi:predicted adenylyl cyclase CyaB